MLLLEYVQAKSEAQEVHGFEQVLTNSVYFIVFPAECRAAQWDVWPQTEGGPAGGGQAEPAEEQPYDPGSGHTGASSGQ